MVATGLGCKSKPTIPRVGARGRMTNFRSIALALASIGVEKATNFNEF